LLAKNKDSESKKRYVGSGMLICGMSKEEVFQSALYPAMITMDFAFGGSHEKIRHILECVANCYERKQ
jgi:hypothetical protein